MNVYEVETSPNKRRVMVTGNIETDYNMNGLWFKEVNRFKYLGATLFKYGSSTTDIHIKMVTATAAMTGLHRIWCSHSISFTKKYNLYQSFFIGVK